MKNLMNIRILPLLLSTSLYAQPLIAQDKKSHEDISHKHPIEEIIVSSSDPMGRGRDSIAQGIAILAGDALDRKREINLGDMLDSLPGMAQTSFGPVASRPIIRGLGGDRIRILSAGIGSIDASSTSPDHAVAIDTESAESIEILRGPATLLYGNNAVGGVINVYDGRIPTQHQDEISGYIKGGLSSNGDQGNAGIWITAPLNDRWVIHADGSASDNQNMEIPGFSESKRLRELEEAHQEDEATEEEHHDEVESEEEVFGVVNNTDSSKKAGAVGLSYISEKFMIGFSINSMESNYGVPGHAHAESHEEEHDEHGEDDHEDEVRGEDENTRIDLTQTRFDITSEWHDEDSKISLVRARFGYADYKHQEIEGDEEGTLFKNKGWEGRVEARMRQNDQWTTAFGFQVKERDFAAIGVEAVVPANITQQWGAFFLESWEKGPMTLDFGLRYDHQNLKSSIIGFQQKEDAISASVNTVYTFNDDWRIAANLFNTHRAPNAEELLSNGAHLATRSFDLGNQNLGKERALGGELSIRKTSGDFTGSVTFFYTDYNDFIYQAFTGEVIEELPVLQHTATDARFYGIEAEVQSPIFNVMGGNAGIDLVFDVVKADNLDLNSPLPRIPPASINSNLNWSNDNWDIIISSGFNFAQNNVAEGELQTDSYIDSDVSIGYRPDGTASPLKINLKISNIFDEEIRYHTSFLKDLVPARGRDVKLSVQYDF